MRVSPRKRGGNSANTIVPAVLALACMVSVCATAGQPGNHPAATLQQPDVQAPTDVTADRKVLYVCQACHSLDPGRTIIGPSLPGLIGRQSLSAAGAGPQSARDRRDVITFRKTVATPGGAQSAFTRGGSGPLRNAAAQPSAHRELEGAPHAMPDMPT